MILYYDIIQYVSEATFSECPHSNNWALATTTLGMGGSLSSRTWRGAKLCQGYP
jgi:hypothetical protein